MKDNKYQIGSIEAAHKAALPKKSSLHKSQEFSLNSSLIIITVSVFGGSQQGRSEQGRRLTWNDPTVPPPSGVSSPKKRQLWRQRPFKMHYVALDLNGALSSPPQPQPPPLCRRRRRRHSVVALTLSVLLNFYSKSVNR